MATVRELRKARGWSQQELAHQAGVGIQTIVKIERGDAVLKLIRNAVCQALGTQDVEIVVSNRVKSSNAAK